MFEETGDASFPDREEEILRFWKENAVFEESVEQRSGAPLFSFYDGPPFATGLPHYGHLLAGTIKDVVPRYKTMKGFQVPRRFGWDCHGLPIENEIEKAQNLSGAASIEQFGLAAFNEECRKIVLRYTGEWQRTVERMGRWVDFGNTYRTMDATFMESVWWVFKQLFDQGLVYEGFKVMPFSAKLGTPLSNFEATQNYQEVDDPSITVAFPLVDDLNTSLLAWTTTPWTLISNLAITAGPEIDYVKVKDSDTGKNYIVAKDRLKGYYKDQDDYTVVETFKGEALRDRRYVPLFDYFADRADEGAFRVLVDPFVSTEEGTGLVHTAPAFGEADFFACKEAGIDIVSPVDMNGKFTDEVPEYAGLFVKDADKEIIKRIKKGGRLIRQGTIRHRYPFCWRSDTPLIYLAVSTWFVAVEKIKEKLLRANEQIHWTPGHLKHGRFGKWLQGARDWAISRNRYWGTPIPLWRSDDGEVIAIGSIEELEERTGAKVDDLHRHFIDDLTFEKEGKTFRRVTEVFDCWFESGSMPYAQNHYPFENKEQFEKSFPADFIAEGLDQTRGWFYTLTILASALFDEPAFKNIIVNGIILAEDGTKMSKRLKNYPDPAEVINKYGADAIRLYLLSSAAVRGDDLCFTERGVELVLRQVMIPLWNAFSFLGTYARIADWTPEKSSAIVEQDIDRWIVSLLQKLIYDVEEGMDAYDLSRAVEPFIGFVDQLTNWYIRRSRRRFWESDATPDRDQALYTLYTVMVTLSKVVAPFVPFLSEAIYQNLRNDAMADSVHLCDYPSYNARERDEELEASMAAVQQAVSMGHALRKEHHLKVRQPLPAVHLITADATLAGFLKGQEKLIAEELNVKDVVFSSDETEFLTLQIKPNFRVLGKKVGKMMRAVQQAITTLSNDQLQQLQEGKSIVVAVEDEKITLTPEDVAVERRVKEGLVAETAKGLTVVLDTALSEELRQEGLAREVVNKINTMRRNASLAVVDRIKVTIDTSDRVRGAFEFHSDYICNEILAVDVAFGSCEGEQWDLNGESATIRIEKVEVHK